MENNDGVKMNSIEKESSNNSSNSNNGKSNKGKKIWVIIGIIIVLAVVGIVVYYKISEYNCTNNKNYIEPYFDPEYPYLDKPIIYLYPEKETDILVKLEYFENITCSYPLYKSTGWKVKAKPNSQLIDLETGKNLYALYYESKPITEFKVENEGFIVKNIDIIQFLEEKLSTLGLTERETEEFIIYWLPILQENEYNYIRFATIEEINENMPLNIEPSPDTIIRVLMTYKGLQEPIEVTEQKLVTPNRQGFVVVEWGGTEIN